MKVNFHFYYFLTLALIALALFGVPTLKFPHFKEVKSPITKEQARSHRIKMFKGNEKQGTCSATAIGPHSILTAEHCVEDHPAYVSLDLSTEKQEILAASFDGRDHVILLLGGSPFLNYEEPVTPPAIVGETVTIYGDEGGAYPPVPRYGKVTDCEDPSDIDASSAITCYSFETIPGDSGSAVYNVNGEIVGIVTYRLEDTDTGEASGVGFSLSFSKKVLDAAYAFNGELPEPK